MSREKAETPVWKLGRAESTAMRVERQIKEALLDGHFAPGDFLGSENDLATQFGVSRLPIREALGRLQALGVVDIRTGAGGGARIAQGNPSLFSEALAIQLKLVGMSAEEIFDAQYTIEVAVAGLAAQAATAEDIETLEVALENAQALVGTQHEFTQASMAFRNAVAHASHNHFLEAMMQAIVHVLYRSLTPYTTETVAKGVIKRHRELLNAIRARNDEAARQVVSQNLNVLREKYLAARDAAAKAATKR
ncbi:MULTISPECIES: FadR/GntR family transcriptional regulator [Pandoraea]|uniref:FCD domain-containing protein n=1 Tax=Pandoraea commovens TaxID=2508289 RepID=A0A5E4XT05_9BURK|nr:FCD domain-containing protein [Pandoraea commovens]UVA80878.1 FCD domain-containing protein [Pandoraea commovens]VVE39591.1 transcriptional regulator [Pandoraea commovens]